MPASKPPITAHPAKPFPTLANAAKEGQLMLVRCSMCKRTRYFLAADLVKVLNPKHPLHLPPFGCTKCRTIEYVSMKVHMPRAGDYGRLPVRRLDRIVQVQKWKDVKLGE